MKNLPFVAVIFFVCFGGCDSTPSAKRTEKPVATQKQLKTNSKTTSPSGSVQSNTGLSQEKPAGRAKPKRGVLGEKAPSLGVTTWLNLPEGKDSLDVSDYKGKVVYLYGFQSWCPGCHKYGFPTLTKLIEHYKNNNEVAFVAVQTVFEGFSTNTPQRAKETAQRYGLTIPVGHSGSANERSTVMLRYRTGGTPWTVIIDREGTVRYNDFHIAPNDAIALIGSLLGKN